MSDIDARENAALDELDPVQSHDVVVNLQGDLPTLPAAMIRAVLAPLALRGGSAAQQARWLPKLASGEVIGAWGLTEPGAGSDAGAQRTSAKKEGSYWVLNGTKIIELIIENGSQKLLNELSEALSPEIPVTTLTAAVGHTVGRVKASRLDANSRCTIRIFCTTAN